MRIQWNSNDPEAVFCEEELRSKRCQMCGSHAITKRRRSDLYLIGCRNCMHTIADTDIATAWRSWNRRIMPEMELDIRSSNAISVAVAETDSPELLSRMKEVSKEISCPEGEIHMYRCAIYVRRDDSFVAIFDCFDKPVLCRWPKNDIKSILDSIPFGFIPIAGLPFMVISEYECVWLIDGLMNNGFPVFIACIGCEENPAANSCTYCHEMLCSRCSHCGFECQEPDQQQW